MDRRSFLASFAVLGAGCAGGSPTATSTASDTATQTQSAVPSRTETPEPTPTPTGVPAVSFDTHGAVGDVVRANGLAAMVEGVELTDTVRQGEYTTEAEEGSTFLLVDLALNNEGEETERHLSLIQSVLRDRHGTEYEPPIELMPEPIMGNITLAPGECARGRVGYRVPDPVPALAAQISLGAVGYGEERFVDLGSGDLATAPFEQSPTVPVHDLGTSAGRKGEELNPMSVSTSSELDGTTAPEGWEYVVLDVVAENTAEESSVHYSFTPNCSVRSDRGVSYSSTDRLLPDERALREGQSFDLYSLELEQGETKRGELPFLIRKDVSSLTLGYTYEIREDYEDVPVRVLWDVR